MLETFLLESVQPVITVGTVGSFTSEDKGDHLYAEFGLKSGQVGVTGCCRIYQALDKWHYETRYNYHVLLAPPRTTPYTPDAIGDPSDAIYVFDPLAVQIAHAVLRARDIQRQEFETEMAGYCLECEERHYGAKAVSE